MRNQMNFAWKSCLHKILGLLEYNYHSRLIYGKPIVAIFNTIIQFNEIQVQFNENSISIQWNSIIAIQLKKTHSKLLLLEFKLNFIELKLNYGIEYCYNRLAIVAIGLPY